MHQRKRKRIGDETERVVSVDAQLKEMRDDSGQAAPADSLPPSEEIRGVVIFSSSKHC
jgi:hypothetical protein